MYHNIVANIIANIVAISATTSTLADLNNQTEVSTPSNNEIAEAPAPVAGTIVISVILATIILCLCAILLWGVKKLHKCIENCNGANNNPEGSNSVQAVGADNLGVVEVSPQSDSATNRMYTEAGLYI